MKLGRREFLATSAAGLAVVGRSTTVSAADDPLGVRDDFPAAANCTYLNSPYITPSPRSVEQAGIEFVRAKASNPISLGAMLAKGNEARELFASLFGAKTEEISFLFATSEGENIVAASIDWKPGDNVVVDDLHYETTYVLYQTLAKTKGIDVRIVRSVDGRADPAQFEAEIDERTRIVSVSWVSHQNGFRHDLKGLSELAHTHGAYLYTDGIQALGTFETNLHEEGVDFVTAGTYKWLLGAFGIAPFFIREEHLDRVPVDRLGWSSIRETRPEFEFGLYDTAQKYEYATLAFGPLYQLAAGLKYLTDVGLGRIEAHTVGLAAYMRAGLVEQGLQIRTPANNASGIVAFYHGAEPEAAQASFEKENIKVSFRDEGRQIRAGAALFNTKADIDHLLETTKKLARG
jgi:selenocysteine lyase/cysteine desulfurase